MQLIDLLETVDDDAEIQITPSYSFTYKIIENDYFTKERTLHKDYDPKKGKLRESDMRNYIFDYLRYNVSRVYAENDVLCIDVNLTRYEH